MKAEYDPEAIVQFWEQAGADATTPDTYLGRLEEENIREWLPPDSHVLELGCGDGRHSIRYAGNAKTYVGVDTSPSLVRLANARFAEGGLSWAAAEVNSALSIEQYRDVDVVISQRCLINLGEWRYQREAIEKVASVLRPGGRFLLTEGFRNGLNALNAAREEVGLQQIREVPFNCFLEVDTFLSVISPLFHQLSSADYGWYTVFTRLLYPLVTLPKEPRRNSVFNERAMKAAMTLRGLPIPQLSYNLFYAMEARPASER